MNCKIKRISFERSDKPFVLIREIRGKQIFERSEKQLTN